MCATKALNLSCFHFWSLPHQCYSLVVALHSCSHGLAEVYTSYCTLQTIFVNVHAHLKFTVSGWSKQTSKQANTVMLVWGLLRLAPTSTDA